MKKLIPTLRVGDIIPAQVVEVISPRELILNFLGDLLRVKNHSHLILKEGDPVQVRVMDLNPFRFQILSGINERMDIKV